jgi:hypothetical protein
VSKKAKEEQYRQKLEEYEAEQAAKAKLFNPQELVKEAKTLRQKHHPKLGLVNYGVLTIDELFDLDKITEKDERSKAMLWMMLRKAYPDLTKEDVGRFPGVKAAELLKLMTQDADFLPQT